MPASRGNNAPTVALECDRLNLKRTKCTGRRTNGEQCGAYAQPGRETCWYHGGAGQPNATMTGSARVVTAKGMLLYGAPIHDISPVQHLMDELARTAGHVAWLQEQIAVSDPTNFVKSMWMQGRASGFVQDFEVDNFSWNAASAIWVDLYMKERKHLVYVVSEALRHGVEERKIRLAENLAGQLGASINWMLEQLGLDTSDPEVRRVAYMGLMKASGQFPVTGDTTVPSYVVPGDEDPT